MRARLSSPTPARPSLGSATNFGRHHTVRQPDLPEGQPSSAGRDICSKILMTLDASCPSMVSTSPIRAVTPSTVATGANPPELSVVATPSRCRSTVLKDVFRSRAYLPIREAGQALTAQSCDNRQRELSHNSLQCQISTETHFRARPVWSIPASFSI
jgi:hypothetical protein